MVTKVTQVVLMMMMMMITVMMVMIVMTRTLMTIDLMRRRWKRDEFWQELMLTLRTMFIRNNYSSFHSSNNYSSTCDLHVLHPSANHPCTRSLRGWVHQCISASIHSLQSPDSIDGSDLTQISRYDVTAPYVTWLHSSFDGGDDDDSWITVGVFCLFKNIATCNYGLGHVLTYFFKSRPN